MNAVARRMRQGEGALLESEINGMGVLLDPAGVLVVPDERCLIVSDLHLEKGAAFARRGMMLPPYDTAATLSLLERTLERHRPARVVCLGDSFHDRRGAGAMPGPFREHLSRLMAGRDWLWITGNHDPEAPAGFAGQSAEAIALAGLTLRHEPSAGRKPGEIAGHLHPAARVSGRGRSVRGACFASDGARMILPSFGVTTGGLNLLDRAFAGLFDETRLKAFVLGVAGIYPIALHRLSVG